MQGTSMVLDVAAKTATVFDLHLHQPVAFAVNGRKPSLATVARATGGGVGHLNAPGSEDLGARTIEGFAAVGVRRTRSTEAGAAKGTSPNIVTESWFSSELKVELLVTTLGPQSASRTSKLTNITPGEPDPTVFQAPADYAVQESGQAK